MGVQSANFGLIRPFRTRVSSTHTTYRQTPARSHFILTRPTELGSIIQCDVDSPTGGSVAGSTETTITVIVINILFVCRTIIAHLTLISPRIRACDQRGSGSKIGWSGSGVRAEWAVHNPLKTNNNWLISAFVLQSVSEIRIRIRSSL